MRNLKRSRSKLANQRGAAAIIVAVSMIALLGFAAIAVDTGYLMVAKNELQNVADAAALAAARQLGSIYEPMTAAEQQSYTCDPGTITPVAQNVAQMNTAAGQSITIQNSDVVIGQWDSATHILTPTLDQPNAVMVTARRETGVNGAVTTFFAKILGIDTADISADAIAALTGQALSARGGWIFRWGSPPDGLNPDSVTNRSDFILPAAWKAVPAGIPLPVGPPMPTGLEPLSTK